MLALLRQRRRLIALTISGALVPLLAGAPLIGLVIGPICGAVIATVILTAAPTARRVVECLAIAAPLAALLPLHPIATPITMGALTLLLHIFLHGGWSDRTTVRLRFKSGRSTTFVHAPARAWRSLVPGEGTPAQHWRPTLIDFASDEDDPLTLYLRFATNNGIPKEAMVTFLSKTPETACRFLYEVAVEDVRVPTLDESIVSLNIKSNAPGTCVVDSTVLHPAMLPRIALSRWLDDTLGDEWHHGAVHSTCSRRWSLAGRDRIDAEDLATA